MRRAPAGVLEGRPGKAPEPQPPALDRDVVARLRAGEPAAFSQVYAFYRSRLHAFLLRLTRDEQLARDLGQETWLRLAVNARRLAPDSEPGAWLFTVARNLYVSRRRWALLDRARLAQLAFLGRLKEPAPSPLEALCSSEAQRGLERALARLSHADRELVLLICVEGFAAEQVAAMLGIAPAAVRKRLSRARARLSHALQTDSESERLQSPAVPADSRAPEGGLDTDLDSDADPDESEPA